MSNQPILCHRPLHVEGRRKRRKGQGKEGGREEGREGGRPGRSGTLPTASRSLYQVPMEGRVLQP